MHKIEFKNITKEFPESISEMTAPQYRYFCFLEMNRQLGKISMERLEVLFVYFVLDMVHTTNAPKVVENITALRELVAPYFTTQISKGKEYVILDYNFVTNPLTTIECNNTILYGPLDALQNCSYEEVFVHAQNALLDFASDKDEDALDRLVAILYRPGEKGKRPKFKAEDLQDHLPIVKQLLPEVKFGIYLFFASCQKFITSADELDIGGGVTVNIAELFKPDSSQGTEKGIGPVGIIYSLAESGVFGNAQETARQNVYDVLIRMVQLNQQAKTAKKNAKRK